MAMADTDRAPPLSHRDSKRTTTDSTRHSALAEYINALDLSTNPGPEAIANVYAEIGDNGAALATNPHTATALERLVLASTAAPLLSFVETLPERLCYTQLGSRVLEAALRRLTECFYDAAEPFDITRATAQIIPAKCITSRDGAHVLRAAIGLLAGCRMVQKRLIRAPCPATAAHTAFIEKARQILKDYEDTFSNNLNKITTEDAWLTLLFLLRCRPSEALLATVVERDCTPATIAARSFFYEGIAELASKPILAQIYARIKDELMPLATADRTSYFVRAFVQRYSRPWRIFRRLRFSEFERNSNVVLALFEALVQALRCPRTADRVREEVALLVNGFYGAGESAGGLFKALLLAEHGSLDTKYVAVVCALMALPASQDYNTNADFTRLFEREWLRTRAGITLAGGFLRGGASSAAKQAFFSTHIDAFWCCAKWTDGEAFARALTGVTAGHSRKKAFEMLERARSAKGA